jgi:hypothetical protein
MSTIGIVATTILLTGAGVGTHGGGELDSVWALVDASAAVESDGQRKDILKDAERLAREALVGHEDDLEHRYALAVVLGLRANVEGGQTKVGIASELITELETVLEMDPSHAGARHILGRLHAGVRRMGRITRWIATNLLGGDELKRATWEAAEENLAFAEQHSPEVADHHLQLALLYRDTDRPELAAEEISHVMDMQATTAMEMAVHKEAMEVWVRLQP